MFVSKTKETHLHGSKQIFDRKKIARVCLSFTLSRGTVQVFERQTMLQSVTEFAWLPVNGLQNISGPASNFSGTERCYIFAVFAFKIKVIIIWKMIQ